MTKQAATKLLPLKLKTYATERLLPVEYLAAEWDLTDDVHLGVHCIKQPYTRFDLFGALVDCDPRWRYANKKLSPKDAALTLYGQKQLVRPTFRFKGKDESGRNIVEEESRVPEGNIYLVEGESDTQTMHYADYTVLGVPGTETWNKCLENDPDVLKILEGPRRRMIIIQEPPSAAERKKHTDTPAKMVAAIKASFPRTEVLAVKLWRFAPKDEHGEPVYKDVSGLWIHCGGQASRFHQALHRAVMGSVLEEQTPKRKLVLTSLDDVEMDYDIWLWEKRIPDCNLAVFSGMAERGKSTVAADLVARLTSGRNFPDAQNLIPPSDVLILSAEESYSKDVKPRLVAANADLKRVFVVQPSDDTDWELALDHDLGLLEEALLAKPNVKLIVIDPITSYVGEIDPNRPKEVRPFLGKLRRFAERMNIAILLIMHFSKNPDVAALHRSGGAATWTDYPRAVWLFDKKKDEEGNSTNTLVMVPGKVNKVAESLKKTLEYTITGVQVPIKGKEIDVGSVLWGSETDLTMDKQFGKDTQQRKGPTAAKLASAVQFLKEYLADGPKSSKEVVAAGKLADHSEDTLWRAKDELGFKAKKVGTGWVWELPMPD